MILDQYFIVSSTRTQYSPCAFNATTIRICCKQFPAIVYFDTFNKILQTTSSSIEIFSTQGRNVDNFHATFAKSRISWPPILSNFFLMLLEYMIQLFQRNKTKAIKLLKTSKTRAFCGVTSRRKHSEKLLPSSLPHYLIPEFPNQYEEYTYH